MLLGTIDRIEIISAINMLMNIECVSRYNFDILISSQQRNISDEKLE